MATRDEIGAAMQDADAAGDAEAVAALAQAYHDASEPSLRDTLTNAMSRYGEAFAGAANRMGVGILDTPPPTSGRPMVSSPEQRAKEEQETVGPMRADLAAYEAKLKSGALGIPGMLGDITPEILASAVPIARAGTSMLPLATRLIGKRAAPLVADVLANAGYEGTKSAYMGNDAGDIALDALKGGGGAAAGRAVANVGGRLFGGITDEARTLLKRGITPTYGQAFGNEGIVAAAERGLSNFPLAGAAVDRAKGRALSKYSEAEIDTALKGTGIPHEGSGFKAVRQINDEIHRGYEVVKPQTFLQLQDVKRAAGQTQQAIKDIPLLTSEQADQVGAYYSQKVVPLLQRGNVIDGVTARKLDVELGTLARSRMNSVNPSDHPLGEAFFTLQMNLRDALKSNDPAVLQQLQQLNGAYRRMIPINIATERATSTKGVFTPDQFRGAMTRQKVPGYDPRLALNDVARETLNEPGTGLGRSLMRNVGVPGLGAGASVAAHTMGVPAEAIAAANAAVVIGGTGVAHALYSEPGIRMMLGAMDLIPSTAKWIYSQTPEKQQEFVLRMMAENPVRMKQIAAQIGRELATQED